MGRLIDADKLRTVIHRAYSDDLEILDKIDDAETVDAIPIDWINQRIETLAETGGLLANLGAALVMKMVDEWKQEQNG